MGKDLLDLEVPYGLRSDGYLEKAGDAHKIFNYLCPECEEPLVLRAGEHKIKHFAHKANTNCSSESIIHKTAKMLIAQIIRDQADILRRQPLYIQCYCICCNVEISRPLPYEAFTSAQEEKPIDGYICDVVAQRNEKDVLAIEIFFTHEVDEIKAKNLPLPWIELTAESVLSNPYYWRPTQFNLKKTLCEKCKEYIKKLNSIIEKYGLEPRPAAIYRDPTKGQYLAEIETCWKCKQEIPVFWWHGIPFCQLTPPEPRPKTIKFLFVKTYGGKYWANTCANCGATQGDNFLFLGNTPVIKGLPIMETREMQLAKIEQDESRAKSIVDMMFPRQF